MLVELTPGELEPPELELEPHPAATATPSAHRHPTAQVLGLLTVITLVLLSDC